MKENKKKQYEAPIVETLNARVETGYFLSGGGNETLEEGNSYGENDFLFS